ncbi:MAG: hypothetical protein IJ612_07870 [Prevotella sp.]|nr:hypothetical protein [Prevotella sp.]
MHYEQQILQILTAVGERGISMAALAKHVFNLSSTFFYQPDLQEVKAEVQKFVRRNTGSRQSLLEHAERRGWYRLNTASSSFARQLMLDFEGADADTDVEKPAKAAPDLSLSLFGEEESPLP